MSEIVREYVANNPKIKSKQTERQLEIAFGHLARMLGREVQWSDLTDSTIIGFMRFRRNEDVAEATLEHEAAKIAAVAKVAAKFGRVPSLTISVAHQQPGTPKALLAHQIRNLFRAAAASPYTIGGVPERFYFVAVFAIIWDTGERIGAIHKLQRSDIDLERRELTFRRRKGERGRARVCAIARMTARAIQRLLDATPSEDPFAPVLLTSLYRPLNRILDAAGIPRDRKLKFHGMRRSHASYYKAAGGDATASLGHSSEAVTRKHYLDPKIANAKSPADLLFSPFSIWKRLGALINFWSLWGLIFL